MLVYRKLFRRAKVSIFKDNNLSKINDRWGHRRKISYAALQQKSHDVMTKIKLRSVPLFTNVSEDHLSRLAATASVRQVPARAVLFTEGNRVNNLYTLIHGAAELFSAHDDQHFTIAVVGAARSLAVSSILADWYPLSARVLEPSELVVMPAKTVAELINRDPGLAHAVVRELAQDSAQIIEDFKSHRLLTTTERIAHWMLCRDANSGGTGKIVVPFGKRLLASYLGMAPEQLSRNFSALAAVGVVVEGRSITLTDRAALAEVAGVGARLVPRPPHSSA